ncbi:MAG: thiamine biosynthesis protein ThiF [Gammaproteobacteria bacterium]|nr:thiamine biosynthesis protein ThiF [Gammaproteobacteria bacterium]
MKAAGIRADADSLHRLVKHVIDSGGAESVEAAEEMFLGYRLGIEIGPEVAGRPADQAALLTAVAVGRRVFLGGVSVSGCLTAPLAVPLALGETLEDAVVALGGEAAKGADRGIPTVIIGGAMGSREAGFCVRTAAAGWRGGVLPNHSEVEVSGTETMPLAGMLAGALAVNEAYLYVSGSTWAGRRVLGMSLWDPHSTCDWLVEEPDAPKLEYLPSSLWLIGLGHLGQAYLWGLGLLPYKEPGELSLVLQDVDVVTESTESTSVLTDESMLGRKKTRVMAEWAELRGFTTSIHERLFDGHFRRQESDEPAVALCGVDNADARRALDQVGFDLVIEAGLGRGHHDFRTIRLHTLPGSKPASEIWKGSLSNDDSLEGRAAYRGLLDEGILDQCGVTLLAGKAVGAPFVGAVAATLVLAELLRVLHCGGVHQVIDLDLMSLEHRIASGNPRDFGEWNPGFCYVD